ncbi:MAG: DNA polymerase I [Alphaproteobacteria bacterium]|nr:DNA polymerase I [Alphaproteobacteria bacterium]MBO6629188.1 DNA polymerase I [Alphaproteobacteria bacterium]
MTAEKKKTNAPTDQAKMGVARPIGKGDHLFLVDGSGYIFRAYHALPPLTRKSDGLPVGAVHGFCNMLYKLIEDTKDEFEPTHLAVIFDASGKSFRNEIYSDYKAHRPPAPEDLVPQFGLIRDATRAFAVPAIEMMGFEADDIIATYARMAREVGARVTIVSSDKDLMQMVGDGVDMLDTMKYKTIGPDEVVEKFGVGPDKVIDVQSLAGDSADNVPGVPGIGIKTAALLINEYGDLETLLSRASEIKQNKRRENLIEFAEQARISHRLVTLAQDVPVEEEIESFGLHDPDPEVLIGFFKDMEFNTLTRRVAERFGVDGDAIGATGAYDNGARPEPKITKGAPTKGTAKAGGVPGAAVRGLGEGLANIAYETVTSLEALQPWIEQAFDQGEIALDTETDSLDAMQARLVGVSLALAPGKACYIPLQHGAGEGLDFSEGTPAQIPLQEALAALKPLLEAPSVRKIGQNIKYDLLVLKNHGLSVAPIDDTMLMSYALDAGRNGHGMDELSQIHLDHTPIPFKEVAGTGKKQITFDQVPIDKATAYAAEDADVTLRLARHLKPRLIADRKVTLYETLERPLVPVLVEMERAGIKVDRAVLSRLSGEFAQKMAGYEAEVYELAGETFNIASPKQLGEILFDKMGLPGGKKTKTGAWSTDASTLEDLATAGHDLPAKVLEWRGLAKLKSTYTDALPEFIQPSTGRVHTSYSMAGTSTGRLASTEPNLQNIPIRTEDGRRIRTAFIAEKGNKLISADYSQIELRLVAHIADVPQLKKAFADGIDIHAMTASEIFNVPVKDMDPSIRRRAKAINFGIIYGISAFGLANQLGISRGEAAEYIDLYFDRFPGIRTYMEETKARAHEQGYVETIFGRRIHLSEINSKNQAHRAFLERAAINAPIQGSAADIIRRAMIKMSDALKGAKLNAQMLLQVHDELIFEAPADEADKTCAFVSEVMSKAAEPALHLSVPLDVEAQAADNWDEAH